MLTCMPLPTRKIEPVHCPTAGRTEKVAVIFFKNLEQLIKKKWGPTRVVIKIKPETALKPTNKQLYKWYFILYRLHDNTLNFEVGGLIAIYEV